MPKASLSTLPTNIWWAAWTHLRTADLLTFKMTSKRLRQTPLGLEVIALWLPWLIRAPCTSCMVVRSTISYNNSLCSSTNNLQAWEAHSVDLYKISILTRLTTIHSLTRLTTSITYRKTKTWWEVIFLHSLQSMPAVEAAGLTPITIMKTAVRLAWDVILTKSEEI